MSIVSYKCPNCGGTLTFDPEDQKLKCEYCLSIFSEKEVENLTTQHTYDTPGQEIIEDCGDTNSYFEAHPGDALLYTCPSCGAQIVTDEVASSTKCCYCHTPVAFTKQLSAEFKPSKVIPFKKSKEQAVDTFLKWCKHKKFLPDDFTSPSQLDNISGVYIPYWMIDCHTTGYLQGSGKKIKSWRSGDYRYTQTDIYSISRTAKMSFTHLPHDASSKADDKVMESIAPYNLEDLENFSYAYLSGFMSEKYDVSKDDVYPVIKSRVEDAVKSEIRSSVSGYNSTSMASTNVQINKTRFHYTLMPVWLLTYLHEGKTYTFAMNGQTGKTYGALPVCKKKLNTLFITVFLTSFAIILFALLYTGGVTL